MTEPRATITVTLNPALDVSTSVPVVTPEQKLRCQAAVREPGGGGINVARVVGRLGVPVTAIAVVGGAIGRLLMSLLEQEGLEVVSIETEAETRQSFSVAETSTGHQFRFVLPGPAVQPSTVTALRQALSDQGARAGDSPIVVVSGSAPPGLEPGALTELIDSLDDVDVIVDTSGQALREAIRSTAMLIKPSARELGAIVERPLLTEADVLGAAEQVVARSPVGAVLASIGAGGALLVRRGCDPVRLRAPTVQVRSAVGAGDSLVGGLATGLARGLGLVEAAALGVAAGTAAVLTEGSGLCSAEGVEELRPLVVIE